MSGRASLGRLGVLALCCAWAWAACPVEAGNILFVGDQAFAGVSDDPTIVDYLEVELGHTVTSVHHSDDLDIEDALPTTELVMISSTVSSGTVLSAFGGATALKNLAKPLMCWEDFIFDDLQVQAQPEPDFDSGTVLDIANVGHPLAAGFTGEVEVYSASAHLTHGSGAFGTGVNPIATLDNGAAVISLYEQGDLLVDGTPAPAARLQYFIHDATFHLLTDDGLALFDAAIEYFFPSAVPGDADGDGVVDLTDLGILATNWGRTDVTVGAAEGDFDDSGTVDLSDLGILATNWGTGTEAVPEPATMSLLGLGGLVLLKRTRKS